MRPVKIFVGGPPCSGKSFFGQQLAEHYNVPHIHMERLLADLRSWDQEKEDIWRKREAERQAKIEEIRAERAAAKEERRRQQQADDDEPPPDDADGGDGDDGEPKADGDGDPKPPAADANPAEDAEEPIHVPMPGDEDDDFQLIDIKERVNAFIEQHGERRRIPEAMVNEAVRWRLNRNDCQNRGYVLDGYPKNYDQAVGVFVITPPRPAPVLNEDGEEIPLEEEALAALVPTLQKHIYPESVISLHATGQFLTRRAKALAKESPEKSSKWQLPKMADKLAKYQESNSIRLF